MTIGSRLGRRRTSIILAATLPGMVCVLSGCPPTISGTNRQIGIELVAEGLTSPVGFVAANDGSGRLFVLDQVGQIRVIDAGDNLKATPFLDLTGKVVPVMPDFDERGLLGLAFHPNYAANGRFFVFYTAPKGAETPADFDSQTHISEFHVSAADPDIGDLASERILLTIDKPQFNHNGGQLAFGPDGFLYISAGDGGGGDDVGVGHTPDLGNGQDKTKLLGKLLRIDVDSGDPYAVPPDNPFVNDAGARPELWAIGLRNPWRFSFDQGGAHRLFVGDAGQELFEEIDIITPGGNYGWHIKEGLHCFSHDTPTTPPATCASTDADGNPLIDPIVEYSHTAESGAPIGVAVIGGYVYRGSAIPSLNGQYIFGDYSAGFDAPAGRIFAAEENAAGAWTMRELSIAGYGNGSLGRFVLGFGQDTNGEVYVLTTQVVGPSGNTGRVFRIVPAQ